jgi:hypothetical protein
MLMATLSMLIVQIGLAGLVLLKHLDNLRCPTIIVATQLPQMRQDFKAEAEKEDEPFAKK